MTRKIMPHLMFEGAAEEAMNLYVSLFRDSSVIHIERYGPEGPGANGSVKMATFMLADQEIICIDSPAKHGFTFTPAMSLFVNCENQEELDRVFQKLAEGGRVLMPVSNYGFSARFGWLQDRFGVSWQLNLP